MDASLRVSVWDRAGGRCEYCRLHQSDYDFQTFHVEHIIAKQHGGSDTVDNLCLSCSECNWAKGPNIAGIHLDRFYSLFHPRKQNWKRHFRWDFTTLVGKTKTGIVTVQVLNINDSSRVMLREHLLFEGRFPPDE